MISNPVRILTCAALAALMVGCKLNVIVPIGGTVALGEGSPSECPEASVCEIDVTDAKYSEEFTAIPNPGYEFVRWQGGKGFLCADSTNTLCGLSMNGSDFFIAAVASRRTNYIMPVFKDVGVDTDDDGEKDFLDLDDDNDGINDTEEDARCTLNADLSCGTGDPIVGDGLVPVRADGREWAQPDLFTGLSWNLINEVCPAPDGVCLDGAVLNGWDMTGLVWASANDMAGLFNAYLVRPPLEDDSEDARRVPSAPWPSAFAADGWRPTILGETSRTWRGMTRTIFIEDGSGDVGELCDALMRDPADPGADDNAWPCRTIRDALDRVRELEGAWFHHQ